MITFIEGLPRRGKQIVAIIADFAVLGFAMWAALAIRLENLWPDIKGHSLLNLCIWAIAVGLPCCYGFGLYREVTRYVGLRFAVRVGYAVTTIALILAFVEFMKRVPPMVPVPAYVGLDGELPNMMTLLWASGLLP